MKKRMKILGLFLCVLFLCSGCDIVKSSTTRDIRHAGYSVSNAEFECPTLIPSKDGYEKIKFFTNTYAITNDGKFYSLSLGKKYQNNLNCKVPEPFMDKTITAIMDNKVVKTSDGKLYYIAAGDNAAFTPVPENDSEYGVYKLLFEDASILKVMTVDSSNGYYYALKDDGNVYNIVIIKNNGNISQASSSIVYGRSAYGGNIIDFNHVGSSPATYVRTETQIFRMKAQNKEECTKYADVPCEYKIALDENLTKHQDKILGFSGNFLITDYGKQFSAAA